MSRKNLIDWSRSCHYDWLIPVKEVKGKRWMHVLRYLEAKSDFLIDDYSIEDGWKVILKALNDLSDEEVNKLNASRYER